MIETPTKKEVKKAVFRLNKDSASGPDEFFGDFFSTVGILLGRMHLWLLWPFSVEVNCPDI